jgi:spermidine synthase
VRGHKRIATRYLGFAPRASPLPATAATAARPRPSENRQTSAVLSERLTATNDDPTLEATESEPPVPAARRREPVRVPLGRLRLIVFVVGAASLGAEISAARLLAPYFGASTIIWANTIATVLVALSIGYAVGGNLADRRRDLTGLCGVVLLAGMLLALVPFIADPFLRLSVRALGSLSVGGFLGSLAAVLVLVAIPVLLLGTVAPYANRLALDQVADTGRVTGRLYAISTAGSLLGTFSSALLLIPLIGTHRTFLVFALALAAVATTGLASRRLRLIPLAVAALLLIPPAAVGADRAGGRVIYETETEYQYARVVQLPTGERWLELNEGLAVHSDYRPWSYLTGNYWDDFLVLPYAGSRPAPPQRVAILGNAAGTVARAYGHYLPRTRVDAVELDGELSRIGQRYFGLRGPNLHLYTADARPWLAAQNTRYDAIFLDAYRQPYIPFYLLTREFFQSVRAHLQAGGMLIVNVGHIPTSDRLEQVVTRTLRAAFGTVMRDPISASNSLVIASNQPVSAARLLATAPPPGLRRLAASVAGRLGPGLGGGTVFTDDRAPVEWLTDLSILDYATGTR